MRTLQRIHGAALTATLFLFPLFAAAATLTISAVVISPEPPTPPDTIIKFRGIAYPNATITFERQGTILATLPTDPTAKFDVLFGSQPAGIWTYSVYAEDIGSQVGIASNFTLSITSGTTTTISGIFLGPTIAADESSIALSDSVLIFGTTAPAGAVTIFVSSEEEKTFTTTAGSDGVWTKQILGSDIGLGDHNIRSKATTIDSGISAFSRTIPLTVTDSPPELCDGRNRADLNCDGLVNLTDFSILLFYWQQRNPANARADINADGTVNLTDFSILLFNWTG